MGKTCRSFLNNLAVPDPCGDPNPKVFGHKTRSKTRFNTQSHDSIHIGAGVANPEICKMADPIFKSLVAFALFASLLLCSSFADASSDVPFILAHKKATLNRLKSGAERVSVTIDIYNQGTSTAYDVSLTDDSWPNDAFNVVSGSLSKTWERLDAGGILSHTFELEATQKGVYSGEPAVIKFRVPTKAALQEAYSTPILPLDVLADRPPENKLDLKLLAKYGSLVSVITIVVLFVYLVATPSKSSSKASKKRR